jgi:hypothetical protein
LWGGDITAFGEVDSTRISEKMSRDLASVYPQLVDESGSIPIEYSWSGLDGLRRAYDARDWTSRKRPLGVRQLRGDMVSTPHRLELDLWQKDSAVHLSAGVL